VGLTVAAEGGAFAGGAIADAGKADSAKRAVSLQAARDIVAALSGASPDRRDVAD
jgi:hypothetical protein